MTNSPVIGNGAGFQRGEYEALKKRNAWMKAALLLAQKKGFVAPEEVEGPDGSSLDSNELDSSVQSTDKERILRTLVSLKTQLSDAKATIAQQSQTESERVAEAERGRIAALQEAAFFRAKLHALEKGDVGEAAALDRERAAMSEKQLSEVLRESAEFERQIQSLREDVKLEQSLRQSAEERLSETAKRAMAAEGAQMRAYDELAMLQKRTYGQESQLRDHQEQVAQLTSLVAEHQSNQEMVRAQLEEANESLQTHSTALPALQAALAAAVARASEHERLYTQHRDVASQHQDTINQLRSALDSKTAEADAHSSRAADLEALANTHKNEADSHRSALTGGLTQLLDLHQQRTTRALPEAVPDHATERIQSLESEAETLRQLHFQSRTATDAANAALQDLRDRNLSLEKQHTGIRTELSAMRGQLAIALQEVTRLKDQSSTKDMDLRDLSRGLEAAQLRDNLLRRYIADRGAEVPGDEELSAQGNFADKRIRELEAEVDARTKEARDAEHRLREAASRVEELQRDADHGASSRGLSGAAGVSAGGADHEQLERRAVEAEQELERTTALHKERMAQLESDYQTAVQFVKGTEKMLRRMKDELTKLKTENASLQSELATARSGDGPVGESEAAKDIEALRTRLVDITKQAEETAAENRNLEKRLASLITDQKDFHDRSRLREDTQADSNSRRAAELESEVSRLRKEVQEMLQLNQHLSSELKQHSGLSSAATSSQGMSRGLSGGNANSNSGAVAAMSSQNNQLRYENEGLARRLQETEGKLSLLLSSFENSMADDATGGGGLNSNHVGGGGRNSLDRHDGSNGESGRGASAALVGAAGMPGSLLASKDGPSRMDDEGRAGAGGGEVGMTANEGERYSLSSELDKWERDRSLGGGGGGGAGEMDPYST
jgi:chromosome segregation ATPase